MRAITERAILGVLAGTEERLLIRIRRPSQRREVGAFVRAIAEGLVLRLAAGAPIIGFAGFNVDGEGGFASTVGSGHG